MIKCYVQQLKQVYNDANDNINDYRYH